MMADLVVVASYATAIEAHLTKTLLESEGIPCLIANEYVAIPWANMLYNVEVKVSAEDANHATEILESGPDIIVT